MTDAKMAAANTHRRSRVVQSTVPRDDRMTCSSHGLALGLIKTRCLRDFSYLARLISMHDLADHCRLLVQGFDQNLGGRAGRGRVLAADQLAVGDRVNAPVLDLGKGGAEAHQFVLD